MMALVLVGVALAADEPAIPCPDVPPLVDAADAALVEVETDAAVKHLKEAEDALLRCREIFDPATLGKLWLLEGALRSVEGDQVAADDAFAAAGRVAPDQWNEAYGPSMRSQYELARVRDPGDAKLLLVPELGGNRAWIDGAEVEGAPIETTAGLHSLQISDPTGVVLFSQVLYLPADEKMSLETGVPTAARDLVKDKGPSFVATPVGPAPKKTVKPWVVAGSGAALAGAALVAVSFERSLAMNGADDPDALRSRYREHAVTRVGGLGLLGAGAAVLGVGFAF